MDVLDRLKAGESDVLAEAALSLLATENELTRLTELAKQLRNAIAPILASSKGKSIRVAGYKLTYRDEQKRYSYQTWGLETLLARTAKNNPLYDELQAARRVSISYDGKAIEQLVLEVTDPHTQQALIAARKETVIQPTVVISKE